MPIEEAENGKIHIFARTMRENIRNVRVYAGADMIYSKEDIENSSIDMTIPLKGLPIKQFIRVEVEGKNEHWICNTSPFYLKVGNVRS